jgi:CheY-like chemotaxis protein
MFEPAELRTMAVKFTALSCRSFIRSDMMQPMGWINRREVQMSDALASQPIHKIIRNHSILLLDDTIHLRKVILGVFRGIGAINVVHSDNEEEAFRLLGLQQVTMVFCNLDGPAERNVNVISRMRKDRRSEISELPIVVVQSGATASSVAAARQAGANEVLAPPISFAAIESKLRNIILKRSSEQSAVA